MNSFKDVPSGFVIGVEPRAEQIDKADTIYDGRYQIARYIDACICPLCGALMTNDGEGIVSCHGCPLWISLT